ncbi:MAG TPA: dihydrofolate reductase family protein, partial [Lachnospira eligens]|nr:dihydrofolate reductase family protein [Lachnospira eligens]
HVDLKELMHILGEKGIDSVILEGGGTLNFSALQAGIVNRVQTYIAPKIFGGADSKTAVEGQGIANVDEAYRLRNKTVRLLGDDILIEGEL